MVSLRGLAIGLAACAITCAPSERGKGSFVSDASVPADARRQLVEGSAGAPNDAGDWARAPDAARSTDATPRVPEAAAIRLDAGVDAHLDGSAPEASTSSGWAGGDAAGDAEDDANAGSHCQNGVLDGDETDADCGGGTCHPCPPGSACTTLTDCDTLLCIAGVCEPLDCSGEMTQGPLTGFHQSTHSWGAAVADYDRDGLDDVLIKHHSAPDARDLLFRNLGEGNFEAILALPLRDRHGCAAGDVNGDGLVDFVCLLGGALGLAPGLPELWLQDPSGAFPRNHGCEWGLVEGGRGRRPVLFDVDDDGDLDLYVTNWSETAEQAEWSHNRLYLQESGRFVEKESGATGAFGSADIEAVDWDGDDKIDLVVSGQRLRLFRNTGGDFEDASSNLGQPIEWPHDTDVRDVDGDGFVDLVIVTHSSIEVRLNQRSEPRFGVISYSWPLSDGWRVLVEDVTGDGALDFYVVQYGSNCDTPPGVNADDVLLTGLPFAEVPLSAQPTSGCGDEVYLLDSRVLVLNGEAQALGPVQLLDLRSQ